MNQTEQITQVELCSAVSRGRISDPPGRKFGEQGAGDIDGVLPSRDTLRPAGKAVAQGVL